MFSDTLKIILLTLLFAASSPFTLHASEEQTPEAQNKKRSRPQDTAISSAAPSALYNSHDDVLGESQAKYSKRQEDAKSSSAISLRTIDPSQESSVSPDVLLSDLQPEIGYVPSPVAALSAPSRVKPPEEEPEEIKPTFEESRIKTNKLAYFYGDQYFDFTEWESETSVYIEKVRAEFRKIFRIRTMNIALAQLSLIYESDTKTHKIDFMLPYFFYESVAY